MQANYQSLDCETKPKILVNCGFRLWNRNWSNVSISFTNPQKSSFLQIADFRLRNIFPSFITRLLWYSTLILQFIKFHAPNAQNNPYRHGCVLCLCWAKRQARIERETDAPESTRQIYILKQLQNRYMWAGARVHSCIKHTLINLQRGISDNARLQIIFILISVHNL